MEMARGTAAERGLLRGVSIFADLDPASRAALERITEIRDYSEGAVIVSQEEPGEAPEMSGKKLLLRRAFLVDEAKQAVL
jgi:hypothetical protein